MTASFSYYPGCSLHGTAREYDFTARAVCEALGVTLQELPDWNCCGASSAHRTDTQLASDLAARNLTIAARQGHDLVIPCAACYNRLKVAQAGHGPDVPPVAADLAVLSLLELLARREMIDRLTDRLVHSLGDLPVVPYYGCLLARPAKVTGADSAFNPTAMDAILFAAGAQVRRWSCKTTCCGASFTMPQTRIVETLCTQLRDAAIEAGAVAFVTACPMCAANLDMRQLGQPQLPVLYVTELLALALGLGGLDECWKRHRVDPRPMLAERGLLEPM